MFLYCSIDPHLEQNLLNILKEPKLKESCKNMLRLNDLVFGLNAEIEISRIIRSNRDFYDKILMFDSYQTVNPNQIFPHVSAVLITGPNNTVSIYSNKLDLFFKDNPDIVDHIFKEYTNIKFESCTISFNSENTISKAIDFHNKNQHISTIVFRDCEIKNSNLKENLDRQNVRVAIFNTMKNNSAQNFVNAMVAPFLGEQANLFGDFGDDNNQKTEEIQYELDSLPSNAGIKNIIRKDLFTNKSPKSLAVLKDFSEVVPTFSPFELVNNNNRENLKLFFNYLLSKKVSGHNNAKEAIIASFMEGLGNKLAFNIPLCLNGAPGTGKSTLMQAGSLIIAAAEIIVLNDNFKKLLNNDQFPEILKEYEINSEDELSLNTNDLKTIHKLFKATEKLSPFVKIDIDISAIQSINQLEGSAEVYQNSGAGSIVNGIIANMSGYRNSQEIKELASKEKIKTPNRFHIFVLNLDELEKAAVAANQTNSDAIFNILLGWTDPIKHIQDIFLGIAIPAYFIPKIACSNNTDNILKPLLDRFNIINIIAADPIKATQKIFPDIFLKFASIKLKEKEDCFESEGITFDKKVIEAIVNSYLSNTGLRTVVRVLELMTQNIKYESYKNPNINITLENFYNYIPSYITMNDKNLKLGTMGIVTSSTEGAFVCFVNTVPIGFHNRSLTPTTQWYRNKQQNIEEVSLLDRLNALWYASFSSLFSSEKSVLNLKYAFSVLGGITDDINSLVLLIIESQYKHMKRIDNKNNEKVIIGGVDLEGNFTKVSDVTSRISLGINYGIKTFILSDAYITYKLNEKFPGVEFIFCKTVKEALENKLNVKIPGIVDTSDNNSKYQAIVFRPV